MQNEYACMETLPLDVLLLILQPFQRTQETFFLCLVCKRWSSKLQRPPFRPNRILLHYAAYGTWESLFYLQRLFKYQFTLLSLIFSNDSLFFSKYFFQNAREEFLQWALPKITTEETRAAAILGLSRAGNLELLKSFAPTTLTHEHIYAMARGGHIHALQWAKEQMPRGYLGSHAADFAAKNGHFEAVKWIHHNLSKCTYAGLEFTANRGYLEIFDWISQHVGYFYHEDFYKSAAKKGDLKLLEYLKNHDKPMPKTTPQIAGAAHQFEAMKWAIEHGGTLDHSLCAFAAEAGHLETLQYLRKKGCEWTASTCTQAVKNGHIKTLQWAISNGCNYDNGTFAAAVSAGNMQVIKWLKEIGCAWSEASCASAAKIKSLEILKWLRENGCPWDENTLMNAAYEGHLEMVKWAREQGCPWSEKTALFASGSENEEVLKWLVENGCPWNREDCWESAASKNRMETILWIESELLQ